MANEVYYSTSGDARLAETLNANFMLTLSDRAWLWRHPALMRLPDANGSGSTTLKTPIIGLGGVDNMAAVAEGVAVTNTALTLDEFSVTIARQALKRTISDLNEIVDSTGGVNAAALAADMTASAHKRFTDMIATAGAGFTSTVGTTTVDLVTDDIFDAKYTLNSARVPGPLVCLLYPEQMNNLEESIRSEGGAMQWQQATADMLMAKGPGFKGTWLGIEFYDSDLVPTANAGADSAGCMFGGGAIAYREASRSNLPGVGNVAIPIPIYATMHYDQDTADTGIVGNYMVGVSITQDEMGVAIITDR